MLKQLELALAEVEYLRNQVKGKDEIIAQKDEAIKALNALAGIERQRIESLTLAVQERRTANQLDEKAIKSFQDSILDYRQNLDRVTAERDSARRSRWLWAVVGVAVGVIAGRQK